MHLAPKLMEQKYLPNISPLSQAEHTCAASSDLFLLGRLKIFNLCFFYQLACLSTDVTKASMLSCSLSTHAPKISITYFVFVACSLLSHTSFPSSHFIRHWSVEAYYASGWNSRTWAVNENFIGVCEFDIFRNGVLAKNPFVLIFKVENPLEAGSCNSFSLVHAGWGFFE